MKSSAPALLVGLLVLAGCATGSRVTVDRAPSVDLARYRSFGFFSPLGTDRGGYRTLLSERLKSATRARLEALGYEYADASPDFLVNFGARTDDRISVSTIPGTIPSPYFDYHAYRGGFYGGWYGYDRTVVDQYREGTLSIDVVDAASNKLVWEGVGVGRVSKKSAENPDASITAAVNEILASFPPRPAS